MSDTNSTRPKRFYTEVSTAPAPDGFTVLLDGRPVRTPGRRIIYVPTIGMADGVAGEWSAQGTHIDAATMPLTRIVNTVVDAIADNPDAVREDLKPYAQTDLLFYRADAPERLVRRQTEAWDPVLQWAESHLGGLFRVAPGIMHVAQPQETLAAVNGWLEGRRDPFGLAGLHQITTLTGSLLLAIAVHERRLAVDEAWSLAHVDEDWNIEQWGEDEEATLRRQSRYRDMVAAAALVRSDG